MALMLYGFLGRPDDFAATKVGAAVDQCAYLLDFGRPLKRQRWLFGWKNPWIGVTLGLIVPVIHYSEQSGGYAISVVRGEPNFTDIPRLWRRHHGSRRSLRSDHYDGLQVIADFARHFPEDVQ
jgi:hypothetical protein